MNSFPSFSPARVYCAALVVACFAVLALPARVHADASTVPSDFIDESMASTLNEPVGICEVPDPPSAKDPRVLFVEQRTARVGLVAGGTVFTVGTVPGVYSADTERGLLGIAVDPGWPARPYFYIHCTSNTSGHHVVISRFTLTGDLTYSGTGQLSFASSSRYDLLTQLPDNAINHNGGTVRFGPDGALYVSIGDDATGCPAQDVTQPVGKILRLDVSRLPSTAGGPPPTAPLVMASNPYVAQSDSSAMLVWTYGLRNPFRFGIDRQTGDLYIGDVGENTWEEMDRVTAGGMNMGWPRFEGPSAYTTCSGTPPSTPTAPIYSYDHSTGHVIISGGLYRRPATGAHRFPQDYDGDCFLVDYVDALMRRLKFDGTSWSVAPAVPGQPSASNWGDGFGNVSDMLEMSDGSLWYCRQSPGEIRRVSLRPLVSVEAPGAVKLSLEAPRPSPSSGTVSLAWNQPRSDRTWLEIYDPNGRRVRSIVSGTTLGAGRHEETWDGLGSGGAPVRSGIYLVRLASGGATRLRRITLLR